jgi:hypothetical protein
VRAHARGGDEEGSHAIYVSQPEAVAEFIEAAVTATTAVPITA